MLRINKRHILLFFFGILMFPVLLPSCAEHEEPENTLYTMAILQKNEHKNYFLKLDDDKNLLLTDSIVVNYYQVKEGDRILASFTLREEKPEGYDYLVKIFDLYKVTTKPVIPLTPDIEDSIGNDKVEITNYWTSGKYLNIEFQVLGTPRKLHFINLVERENAVDKGFAKLEFRHNREGDNGDNPLCGLVSFDLGKYQPSESNLKGLKIKVNTFYEGEKEYTLIYKPESTRASIPRRIAHNDFSSLIR